MSYLSRPTLGGRAPRRHGRAMGAFETMLCTSLGDTSSSSSDRIRALQQQLNRYVVVPGAVQYPQTFASSIPVTGVLDHATAHRAVMVLNIRSGAAHIQWNDAETARLLREVVMEGYKNPLAYVTKHFDNVLQIVKLFADKAELPPAKVDIGATPSLIVGALTVGALALIWLTGRR